MCEVDISPNAVNVRDLSIDQRGRVYVSFAGSDREIRVYDMPCSQPGAVTDAGSVVDSFPVPGQAANVAVLPDRT